MTKISTNSVRIDALTHHKLTMLSNDLNKTIVDLIREAVDGYSLNSGQSSDSIPVSAIMEFVASYNKPKDPKIKKPKPDTPLPDWLDL